VSLVGALQHSQQLAAIRDLNDQTERSREDLQRTQELAVAAERAELLRETAEMRHISETMRAEFEKYQKLNMGLAAVRPGPPGAGPAWQLLHRWGRRGGGGAWQQA